PAAAYPLIPPDVCTASARVRVSRPAAAALNPSQQPTIGGDASVSAEGFLPTQCQLFKTTPILASALGDASGGHPEKLKTFAGIPRPLTYLKRKVEADIGKKDELITVSFSSRYRDE